MSDIWIKTSNTSTTKWRKAVKIYIKRFSSTWAAAKVVWIKNTSTGWLRVWPTSGVFAITDPYITTTSSGSTPLYGNNTIAANDVIRIGTTYYGRNGTWDPNGFSISSYTYTWPYYSDLENQPGDYDLLGNLGTGTYSSPSRALTISTLSDASATDGKYISFKITANASNALYSNTADSKDTYGKIKVIRRTPINISFGINGSATIGSELSVSSSWNTTEARKPDAGRTIIKWYRSDSATSIYSGQGRTEIISASGSYQYTPTSPADSGKYIVAEETTFNTGSDYDIGIDQFINGQNQVTAVTGQIGVPLVISNVSFTDSNNRSGKNARDNLVTATTTTLNWTVTGVNVDTTFRVRYRVLNNQTGLYYNPNDPTTSLSAGSAWLSYTDNYYGSGTISSVSISGSTATLYDVFTIDETFNGSTYGGGVSRWTFEYELSVVNSSGTRTYWDYITDSMSNSQTNDFWDIDPTTNPSISASPSTVAPNSTVTFSGTFNSYPAGLSSYPYSYKIVYGDNTDSGWITLSSSPANQTYSNTKTYSTTGSYTAYIETTPYYTTNSASVTVSNLKVPPTMGTPTISAVGDFVTGQRRLSVPFTEVTNSGPAYQIYWYPGADYAGSAKPPVAASIDGSGTTSPIRDESGPNGIGRYAVWIRSSATTSTTGSTAPSTTLSDWSDLQYVYISGTRTLSYDDNTTDTVSSFPASSSGTDPWDGWATTVSSNTPTRTGYTFNGYNTSSDGTSGTNYAAGASITLTSNVTLYAKWTANTYAVTYYGNGNTGGSVPDSQTKTHGVNLTLRTNVNSLTKTGYTFAGWNTNSSGTGTDYASGATYSGNSALDLYAKWTEDAPVYAPVVWGVMTAPAFNRLNSSSRLRWGWNNQLPTSGDYTASNITWEWRYSSTASTAGLITSGTRPNRSGGGLTVGNSTYNNRVSSLSGDYSSPGNIASANEPVTFSTSNRFLSYRAVVVGSDGVTYRSNYSDWV
jgi:uncharacterized repeat protein (TIGR02543 family)